MDKVESSLEYLAKEALRQKKVAQAMGVFLKSGKPKKFIEAGLAMKGEFVSSWNALYHDAIWVHIHVKQLEGMKDMRLQNILQTFEFMNPTKTHPPTDYASMLEREFKYEWVFENEDTPTIHVFVHVNAKIKETSETCKREVVGYEPAPRAIYKLVCSDQE